VDALGWKDVAVAALIFASTGFWWVAGQLRKRLDDFEKRMNEVERTYQTQVNAEKTENRLFAEIHGLRESVDRLRTDIYELLRKGS
jgi:elongation factor P hydroxylase